MLPEGTQWSRPVLPSRRAIGVTGIHPDFGGIVEDGQGPTWPAQHVGQIWLLMAGRAARLTAEQLLPAYRSALVEAARWRSGHGKLQLIIEQRGQLRRHEIRRLRDRQRK